MSLGSVLYRSHMKLLCSPMVESPVLVELDMSRGRTEEFELVYGLIDQIPGLRVYLVIACVRPVSDGTFSAAHGGIGCVAYGLIFDAGERVISGKGCGHLDPRGLRTDGGPFESWKVEERRLGEMIVQLSQRNGSFVSVMLC